MPGPVGGDAENGDAEALARLGPRVDRRAALQSGGTGDAVTERHCPSPTWLAELR